MKKSLSLKDFPEEIQKGFVSKSLSVEEITSKIEDNFEKGLISEELFCDSMEIVDSVQKGGKRAQIGEIREFGGRRYIKTTSGWKFYGKGTGRKAQSYSSTPKENFNSSKKEETKEPEKKEKGSEKAPEGVSQQSYDSITKKARATQVGYTLNIDGKDVRVERTIETSGGQRTPVYQIHGMEKKYWDLDKMIYDYRKNNDAGKGKSDNDKEEVKE